LSLYTNKHADWHDVLVSKANFQGYAHKNVVQETGRKNSKCLMNAKIKVNLGRTTAMTCQSWKIFYY